MTTIDKIKGVIFGQAVGDALGLGTEFMSKKEVKEVYLDNGLSDYKQIHQDSHRANWKKGQWTDDTDMMLCIANAVIQDCGVNLYSIAQNFKKWAIDVLSKGIIGLTVYRVLSNDDYVQNPHYVSKTVWEQSGKRNAANGALMRTSIIGVFNHNVAQYAEDVCKLTHYDPRCVASCIIISEIISRLIWDNEELSAQQIIKVVNDNKIDDKEIAQFINKSVNANTIEELELDKTGEIGYTLKTMSAALWCYFHAESFESGLLAVVNEGGDADTNAAVSCAVLGAKFGYNSIPLKYIDGLVTKNEINLNTIAEKIYNIIKQNNLCDYDT